MIREWIKKWLPVILGVLLLISFITIGVFAFSWGKQKAERESLRLKEKASLEVIRIQDSIINAKTISIALLMDSVEHLTSDALRINAEARGIHTIITNDKTKMHEEITNVPFLEPDSNIKLFNRLTDEYSFK